MSRVYSARWRGVSLLARGSAISLVTLSAAQGTALVVEAAVAKLLGPESLGVLAIGLNVSTIFAVTIVS